MLVAVLTALFVSDAPRGEEIRITEAHELIQRGRVESAILTPDVIEIVVTKSRGTLDRRSDGHYHARLAGDFVGGMPFPDSHELLRAHRVPYAVMQSRGGMRKLILMGILPIVLFIAMMLLAQRLRRSHAGAEESAATDRGEHSVIVRVQHEQCDEEALRTLESELVHVLQAADVGRLESVTIAGRPREVVMTMSGASADAIFAAVLPRLEAAAVMHGALVLIRYGTEQSATRARTVTLGDRA